MKSSLMRFLYTIILLNLSVNIVYSQCDSLERASQRETGAQRVDALNEYARCFFGPDFDKMDSLSTLALKAAEEINYTSGYARSIQNFGLLAYLLRARS